MDDQSESQTNKVEPTGLAEAELRENEIDEIAGGVGESVSLQYGSLEHKY